MSSQSAPRPVCPLCKSPYVQLVDGEWHCQACGFRGVVFDCHPRLDDIAPAEPALPEDPVCANHPGKKAVAICAGTGDYICSLCRVELGGQSYSVQYLDRGGAAMARHMLSPSLERPDRVVFLMFVMCLLLGIFSPVYLVVSSIFVYKAIRQRREGGLFRAVMSPTAMWAAWGFTLLHALVVMGGVVTLIIISAMESAR